MVTELQRAGSGWDVNLHLRTLVLEDLAFPLVDIDANMVHGWREASHFIPSILEALNGDHYFLPVKSSLKFAPLNLAPSTTVWLAFEDSLHTLQTRYPVEEMRR
jgi:hypothetical protein